MLYLNLCSGERFNVMTFSSGSHNEKWFKEDLVDVTPASIQEALSFVDSIRAYGGLCYFKYMFYIIFLHNYLCRKTVLSHCGIKDII